MVDFRRFFCGGVAEQKRYSRANWVFAGFLFDFIALIAVAGLPDRKQRKYLRQIGEKQNAIEPEGKFNNPLENKKVLL